MEATFEIDVRYKITGEITDGPRIELPNGSVMIGKRFSAFVYPGTGFGGVPRLRIDRLITVTGPKLKTDGTPGKAEGKFHYWLSEESTPVWVRVIADRIESTECPRITTPAPVVLPS